MKTYSKSLLIAVAAVAVTASTANAHSNLLKRAGLSEAQRAAVEQAREFRQAGDVEAARDVLLEAGFDEVALEKLRSAAEHHEERHAAFMASLEDELGDDQLQAIQVAHEANDRDTVHAILAEAGIEQPQHHFGKHRHVGHHRWQQEHDDERD